MNLYYMFLEIGIGVLIGRYVGFVGGVVVKDG